MEYTERLGDYKCDGQLEFADLGYCAKFVFPKVTDIQEVRVAAVGFLRQEPEPVELENFSGLFVIHPILDSAYTMTPKGRLFNIFEEKELFEEWLMAMESRLTKSSIFSIFNHIRNPYKIPLLKYVYEFLSEQDFNEIMRHCWQFCENPSDETNISQKELLMLLSYTTPSMFMEQKDYFTYNSLPQEIEVFRGVRDGRGEEGFSWTLNFKQAQWFATRYNGDKPTVYAATVQKEDTFAYMNTRQEREIIVNPHRLLNCHVIWNG